jgi:hypothetical protein
VELYQVGHCCIGHEIEARNHAEGFT